MNIKATRNIKLDSYAAIHIGGKDAVDFLNGQLCNDVAALRVGDTQITAMSNPKGRVLAVLHLSRLDNGYCAILPSDNAQALLDDLKRYVFRAKVTLELNSETVVGCISKSGIPVLNLSPGLPTDDDTAGWNLFCVDHGQPEIYPSTRGQFVAQMINLDLLDGINFEKGCYTGQEIIARTQNLGRIKRRMLLFATGGQSILAGDDIRTAGKRVGTVVRCARCEDGLRLLAVIQISEKQQPLFAGSEDDALELLELPYQIPGFDD